MNSICLFAGVEVKPGKTFTLKNTEATGIRRLHLSQVFYLNFVDFFFQILYLVTLV